MKRKFALLMSILMLSVLLFGACAPQAAATPTAAPATEAPAPADPADPAAPADPADPGTTFGIEPMAQRTTLRVGYFSGAIHSLPIYIAEQEGFFDELNIDLEYVSFTGGPAMMEANSSWDFATTGGPGVVVGMVGYGVRCIGICDYEQTLNLYARADSPIVKSGQGHIPQYPELYGTPEDWKGSTWLLPVGTTMQYVLLSAVEKLGLTAQDVNLINMDVSSALTGFKAGEGDGLGVWLSLAMTAENEGFVKVGGADAQQDIVVCGVCTTDDALANKKELIMKAYEVYYRTLEWCADNKAKECEYFSETCEIEGILCTPEISEYVCNKRLNPTMEEAIAQFTTDVEDPKGLYSARPLNQAEIDIFYTFDFFMDQGKYTQADRDTILDNRLMDGSIAKAVYDEATATGRL